MFNFRLLMVLFILFIFRGSLSAQGVEHQTVIDANQTYVSPQGRKIDKSGFQLQDGMEIVELNGVNAVMPKGSKAVREHGMIMLEDSSEYLGRKLADMEARFQKIEATQSAQQQQLEEINRKLEELRK